MNNTCTAGNIKEHKKVLIITFIYFIIINVSVYAESGFNNDFSSFGIASIGIYTEAYEDLRSDNFFTEISVIKSNPMLSSPYFYREEYCNFDLVTPPLTTPAYPLRGPASGLVNDSLVSALSESLQGLGWSAETMSGFSGGTLDDLLAEAVAEKLDAVLVVRYTPIRYFIPVDAYRDSYWGSSGISTGPLRLGLGYIPALELYDAESGTRLWFSAYHAAQHGGSSDKNFVKNVAAAGDFFTELDLSDNENAAVWAAAELSGDFDIVWSDSDVDERAAETMIEIAVIGAEYPFPSASASGSRDNPLVSSAVKNIFWSDHPAYRLHGTRWGIGYSFDYVGKYNLYFRDDSYGSSDDDPSEVIETTGALMHTLALPFYSLEFGNLSFEPEILASYIQPYTSTITYNSLGNDPPWSDEVYVESVETETAVISAFSIGFDLRVKYFFRLTDQFSAFIGAQADARTYFNTVESDAERPIQDRGKFRGHGEGLYFIDGPDLTVNAAAIAGVRFERQNPVEVFAMYHPLGQAGDISSPTISAGVRYMPFTWGWTAPHQKNAAGYNPKK